MSTSVRPGLASDVPALADIRAALSAVEPDRAEGAPESPNLDSAALAQPLEEHRDLVYVAEVHGSVVGYLAMQRAAHPAVGGCNPIQLWQLYVAPSFHGRGVATLLMSAALDHARRHQHDVIWLGVSENNLRARAFYRKHGFKAVGIYEVGDASHVHRDVVMSRRVQ